MKLSPTEIAELRGALEARRIAVEFRGWENAGTDDTALTSLSTVANSSVANSSRAEADADEAVMSEADLAVADIRNDELADLEAARNRLMKGTYGECVDCGGDIALMRLRAYPTAKRCLSCQQLHEQHGRQRQVFE